MAPGQLNARHWIGGEWIDSKDRLDSINPATGETIGTYASGGEAEATKAIAIAKQVFLNTNWRDNRRLRAKAINEMADRFEARMDDLVEILALENGKVVDEARFEVAMAAPKLRFYAALALTASLRPGIRRSFSSYARLHRRSPPDVPSSASCRDGRRRPMPGCAKSLQRSRACP